MRGIFFIDSTMRLKEKFGQGFAMGFGIMAAVGLVSVAYATYATLSVAGGDQLSSSKWNELVSYTVPPGAVMAFNLASCPTGWSAANGSGGTPDLRGEFIRGLDSGRGVDSARGLATSQSGTSFPSVYVYASSPTSGTLVSHPVSANSGYPNDAMAANTDSVKTAGTSGQYLSVSLVAG